MKKFKLKHLKAIVLATIAEMNKAVEKHPEWPTDPVKRAAIVIEEAGEVIREANHLDEGHGSRELLIKELYQTAGTCFRMIHLMNQESPVGKLFDEVQSMLDAQQPLRYYDPLTKLSKDGFPVTIFDNTQTALNNFKEVREAMNKGFAADPVKVTVTKENYHSAGLLKEQTSRGNFVYETDGSVKFIEDPEGKWEVNIIPERSES